MELSGTVRDGVVVLDAGSFPEGTKVRVADDLPSTPTHLEIVKDFVGKAQGLPEDFAEKVNGPSPTDAPLSLYDLLKDVIGKAEGLPDDMADNHDHYLYGSPKK